MEMRRLLYEASLTGDVAALNALLQEDQLILDRISLLTCFNETPLHIASLRGHLDFARLLLHHKPKLATSLDSLRRSPLHLASAEGHLGVVKELLRADGGSTLCNSRDQDARTPLHLAAMNEHLEVVKMLVRAHPEIVRDHGCDTVFHMCVVHNRFQAMKLLMELWSDDDEEEVAKLVDHDGNTLLHLAATRKQTETIRYLLAKSSIRANGNAVNGFGFTALDVLDHSLRDFKALETREILIEAGIRRAKDLKPLPKQGSSTSVAEQPNGTKISQDVSNPQPKPTGLISRMLNSLFKNDTSTNWLERERGNLVIAATIIAAVTFNAGLNPPGGTYSDSKDGHSPGNAIEAEVDMDEFGQFLTPNSIALVVSLTCILVLASGFNLKNKLIKWLLMQGMLTTFVFLIITYLQSIAIMSPDMWINPGTAYLCFIWILLCALFAFVSTVYFIVCLFKILSRHITKRRMARTGRKNENSVCV